MLKPVVIRTVLALLVAAVASSADQLKTIPEQLAQQGRDLMSRATVPSGASPDIEVILKESDLIVRGIIGEPKAYLSDDQLTIFSDYPILQPTILFDMAIATSPKPGLKEVGVVTVEGGTLTIGGLSYTVAPGALPKLQPGSECLLLLKRVKDKVFIAGDGYLGAFEIADGKLAPLAKRGDFAPAYQGAAASVAIDEIINRRRLIVR